jgi:hypothetical protein
MLNIKMKNGIPDDAFVDGRARINRETSRNDRRNYLKAKPEQWNLDFKMNCMCDLKFNIPDVRYQIFEKIKNLKFKHYSIVNVNEWPECDAIEIIKPFFDEFNSDVRNRLIFYNYPNETLVPHRDPIRGLVVYMPIWPLGNDYAPMELYHKNEIYGLPENNEPKIYIFNAQNIHAVFNNEFHRYNMQLSIDMSYQEAVKKYKHLLNI